MGKKGGRVKSRREREREREKENYFESLCRERPKVGNPQTHLINKL